MNIKKQIKEYRTRDGLSQEDLSKRIFVTRQTISNWETGRSYPDIQSLLLMSVLFGVSLDELVKGDLDMMKKEIEGRKVAIWFWIALACLIIGLAIMEPLRMLYGLSGLAISAAFLAVTVIAGVVFEQMKKNHNIETYSEIVALVEGKPVNEKRAAWERKNKSGVMVIAVAGGFLLGIVLSRFSDFIAAVIGSL